MRATARIATALVLNFKSCLWSPSTVQIVGDSLIFILLYQRVKKLLGNFNIITIFIGIDVFPHV